MAKKRTTTKKKTTPRKKRETTKKIEPPSIPETDNQTLSDALAIACEGISVKRILSIGELLEDREAMVEILTKTATGASIDTVGMSLGMPQGVLKQWLKIGEKNGDGPYRAFFEFYMKASAEARIAAEASLLIKNPAVWLDRCEPLKNLNEYEGAIGEMVLDSPTRPTTKTSEMKEDIPSIDDDQDDDVNQIPEGYGSQTFTFDD